MVEKGRGYESKGAPEMGASHNRKDVTGKLEAQ